jgi:HipA-like kinase
VAVSVRSQGQGFAVLACDSLTHWMDTLVELNDWSGLVRGRNDDFDGLSVVAPEPSGGSWGGPFRATASDNRTYFVKSLQTCPQDQQASLAVEQIVAQVGRLIGAPVCETSLIRIPSELTGWAPRPGFPPLEAGLAHASLAVNRSEEHRPSLLARAQDDNSRRHVGVYALYDWCFGADQQWLYELDEDRMIFSHDHGLYFPPNGTGRWTRQDLISAVDQPHELSDDRAGLSGEATKDIAMALEEVNRSNLVSVLASIPASWPVSDQDLEDLGWFLGRRAPAVAARVRALA